MQREISSPVGRERGLIPGGAELGHGALLGRHRERPDDMAAFVSDQVLRMDAAARIVADEMERLVLLGDPDRSISARQGLGYDDDVFTADFAGMLQNGLRLRKKTVRRGIRLRSGLEIQLGLTPVGPLTGSSCCDNHHLERSLGAGVLIGDGCGLRGAP